MSKKQEALKLLRGGMPRRAVAVELSMDRKVVSSLANAAEIPKRKGGGGWNRPKAHRCPNNHLITTKECLQCLMEQQKSW